MSKISLETEKIRYFTDYSNYDLIEFSLETFKYFDINGIKTYNSKYIIKGEIVKIDEYSSQINLNGLLGGLGIEFNNISLDEFKILQKGIIRIPIQVEHNFFMNFYENSKKYKSLFKKFGTSGYYYDLRTGLGNGKLIERIKEQLHKYTELYLNINLGQHLKVNENLATLINLKGSPIFYQSTHNEYFMCRNHMPNVSFGNFNDFGNNKIRTFENILTIESLYLYDNIILKNLGSIETIKRLCYLKNSSVDSLGNLKLVEDTLIIEKCDNMKSVENIKILGNLNLRSCEINTVKNLIIKGNLYVNKKFKDNFVMGNCIVDGSVKYLNPMKRD